MKLHVDRENIERVGVDSEREFTIKTTAKAFDILSSGLYTDNVLAIVRELSCNAFDAHVAASKAEVPFEIHLPNRLEPFFSVKDFGTGLSDEQVMTLYTTYFDSTKTASNDFIGALGLGSKSPFSYTSAFEVIARHEGTRRVYSVFINEDGVPTIARIGDPIKTDEPNGIEVKMTVNESDFYNFKRKTADALRWFPTKPMVVGDPYFNFSEPPSTEIHGDGWYIYKSERRAGKITAVQGHVEYRVDLDQIAGVDSSVRSFLRTVNIIGFFEIGELEVAASREEIRYDKRTKEALTKKINSIHVAALRQIEDKADLLPGGLWNAIIELDKLSDSMFDKTSDMRQFVRGSHHEVLQAYAKSQSRVTITRHTGHDVFVYRWDTGRRTLKRTKANSGNAISPKESTAVFVNDVRTGGVSRLTKWMRDNHKECAVVIVEHRTPLWIEEIQDVVNKTVSTKPRPMTQAEIAAELSGLVEGLGHPNVKFISQDTVVATRAPKTRMSTIYKYGGWRHRSYGRSLVDWTRVQDLDMSTGGLYFFLYRGRTIHWNGKAISWDASEVLKKFDMMVRVINTHLGLEGDAAHRTGAIVGAARADIKKFQADDGWFNLFDLFADAIPTYADAVTASGRWAATPNIHNLKRVINNPDFIQHVDQLTVDSPFRKTVEMLQREWNALQATILPHTADVHVFDSEYGDSIISPVDVEGYVDDNALSMYPMLRFVERSIQDSRELSTIFDYINTIDRSN